MNVKSLFLGYIQFLSSPNKSSPLLDSTLIDCYYLTLVVEKVLFVDDDDDDDDDVVLMYVKQ